MKGYNFVFVDNMPMDGGTPRPFPGKWPTRIAYRTVTKVSGKTLTYTGKPGSNRLRGIIKGINHMQLRTVVAYEFDKSNLLSVLRLRVSAKRESPVIHRNPDLFFLYHPFADPLAPFITEFTSGHNVLNRLGSWRYYGANLFGETTAFLRDALREKGVSYGL